MHKCPLCNKDDNVSKIDNAVFGYFCKNCIISYYFAIKGRITSIYYDFHILNDKIEFYISESDKETDNYIKILFLDNRIQTYIVLNNLFDYMYDNMYIRSLEEAENLIRRTLNLKLFI